MNKQRTVPWPVSGWWVSHCVLQAAASYSSVESYFLAEVCVWGGWFWDLFFFFGGGVEGVSFLGFWCFFFFLMNEAFLLQFECAYADGFDWILLHDPFRPGRKMLGQFHSILENICLALWNNHCFSHRSGRAMYTPRTWSYNFQMPFCFRSVWPFFCTKVFWENDWHAHESHFIWNITVLCDMK